MADAARASSREGGAVLRNALYPAILCSSSPLPLSRARRLPLHCGETDVRRAKARGADCRVPNIRPRAPRLRDCERVSRHHEQARHVAAARNYRRRNDCVCRCVLSSMLPRARGHAACAVPLLQDSAGPKHPACRPPSPRVTRQSRLATRACATAPVLCATASVLYTRVFRVYPCLSATFSLLPFFLPPPPPFPVCFILHVCRSRRQRHGPLWRLCG